MKFDFDKIEDFEKHIELSIPNFLTLDNIFRNIAHEYAQPESTVVDLGCSTGRFLSSLNKTKDVNYFGFDEVDMLNRHNDFKFLKGDCEDLVLSIDEIDSGSVLLISEKVYLNDPRLQQTISRLHIQEKRKGFTDKEILDKDLELSVSMFCKTESDLEKELSLLGRVSKVWQSYNFMGYVVKQLPKD